MRCRVISSCNALNLDGEDEEEENATLKNRTKWSNGQTRGVNKPSLSKPILLEFSLFSNRANTNEPSKYRVKHNELANHWVM